MPTKGPKRHKDEQDAKPETMEPPSPDPGEEVDCWTFALSETTIAAAEVEVGESVEGSTAASRVMVLSGRFGALGFVPPRETSQILEKNRAVGGGGLEGEVVRTGASVEVRLCLYRR